MRCLHPFRFWDELARTLKAAGLMTGPTKASRSAMSDGHATRGSPATSSMPLLFEGKKEIPAWPILGV